MQAAYIEAGTVSVREMARPRRRKGQALLRMRLAGVCNTDLELLRGYYGFAGVPGHEFVADVVACEEAAWVGRRVVGEINLACGQSDVCEWCGRGLGRHCPTRSVLGIVRHPGAFAEYLTLPVENLLAVPAAISDEEAVFTEPVAAACEILEQLPMAKGTRVGVVGDGKLGLLIAQVLQVRGMRVDLFGRHAAKLAIAAPLGVRGYLVRPEQPEYPVRDYEYVVDATGSAAGFQSALGMVRPRGTLVLKSTVAERLQVDMAPVIVNEIRLVGSRCGRFTDAIKLLKRKELRLKEMIAGRFALAAAPEAIAAAGQRGTLKVLIDGQAG
jgi:threonine dehydrogenase-like Zn-dependent dehydrogenase